MREAKDGTLILGGGFGGSYVARLLGPGRVSRSRMVIADPEAAAEGRA